MYIYDNKTHEWTHPPVYPLQYRHLRSSSDSNPTETQRMSETMKGLRCRLHLTALYCACAVV